MKQMTSVTTKVVMLSKMWETFKADVDCCSQTSSLLGDITFKRLRTGESSAASQASPATGRVPAISGRWRGLKTAGGDSFFFPNDLSFGAIDAKTIYLFGDAIFKRLRTGESSAAS